MQFCWQAPIPPRRAKASALCKASTPNRADRAQASCVCSRRWCGECPATVWYGALPPLGSSNKTVRPTITQHSPRGHTTNIVEEGSFCFLKCVVTPKKQTRFKLLVTQTVLTFRCAGGFSTPPLFLTFKCVARLPQRNRLSSYCLQHNFLRSDAPLCGWSPTTTVSPPRVHTHWDTCWASTYSTRADPFG